MNRDSKSINKKKIYIRFTYLMFYLVKVSPIVRVTTYILYLLTMLFDLLIDTFHDYILVIEVVLTNMVLLFKCFFYYISLTSFK